jgi:hypothetical protein
VSLGCLVPSNGPPLCCLQAALCISVCSAVACQYACTKHIVQVHLFRLGHCKPPAVCIRPCAGLRRCAQQPCPLFMCFTQCLCTLIIANYQANHHCLLCLAVAALLPQRLAQQVLARTACIAHHGSHGWFHVLLQLPLLLSALPAQDGLCLCEHKSSCLILLHAAAPVASGVSIAAIPPPSLTWHVWCLRQQPCSLSVCGQPYACVAAFYLGDVLCTCYHRVAVLFENVLMCLFWQGRAASGRPWLLLGDMHTSHLPSLSIAAAAAWQDASAVSQHCCVACGRNWQLLLCLALCVPFFLWQHPVARHFHGVIARLLGVQQSVMGRFCSWHGGLCQGVLCEPVLGFWVAETVLAICCSTCVRAAS